MPDERQNWRKAFELTGPALLRLRLEHRRNEFPPEYAREAEIWLLEQDAKVAAIERQRFQAIRRWGHHRWRSKHCGCGRWHRCGAASDRRMDQIVLFSASARHNTGAGSFQNKGTMKMAFPNRVTSVIDKPNEDGDNVIGITLGDGSGLDAVIDLGAAQVLVEILQRRLVHWASESAKNLSLPQFDVRDVAIAHQGPTVVLLVSTEQMGEVALRMPNDLVRKAHRELGRTVTYGSGPQSKN
jgi:hypothetical protein